MKKIFTFVGILAILGMITPAFAAPNHGPHRGPAIHSGRGHHHHMPPRIHRRHNTAYINIGGVFNRYDYWRYPYRCNCRLGWHDYHTYHEYPYYNNGGYVNVGIPIRF